MPYPACFDPMLARFDDTAQRTLELANEHAVEMRRTRLGSEHVLLALLDDRGVCELLQRMGLTDTDVRREIDARASRGDHLPLDDPLPFGADVDEVVLATFEEADGFGHARAGNPHLLLGLLKDQEGLAGRILEESGVQLDGMRHEVLEHFAEVGAEFEAA